MLDDKRGEKENGWENKKNKQWWLDEKKSARLTTLLNLSPNYGWLGSDQQTAST